MINKNVINKALITILTAATIISSQSPLPVFAATEQQTTVYGTIYPLASLDVTVPIGGISFAIDGNCNITGQGIVVESNSVMPLDIKVLEVAGKSAGDTTNGLDATTINAPTLVSADYYSYEQWDNLSIAETKEKIAIGIKQVDVEGTSPNFTAGTKLTDATTDADKVTTSVELGNLKLNNKVGHVKSAGSGTQRCAINIDTDKEYTNYGNAWGGDTNTVIRYDVTLEFSY